MFQQEELLFQAHKEGRFYLKYTRRKDLSPELRMSIANMALCCGKYGDITKLAQRYNVSRTFIYDLRNKLLMCSWIIFGSGEANKQDREKKGIDEKLLLLQEILVLRLEGKCSIISISLLLKRKGLKGSSIGYISQVLNETGGHLNPVLAVSSGIKIAVIFASDEIYSSSQPLLITVDPVSSAILHMELGADRKGETWEKHWQELLDAGFCPVLLTNDEGSGMKKAQIKVLPNILRQTDTYHAVAHRLGDICRILEQKGFCSIGEEYDREEKIASAKTPEVIAKRVALYDKAVKDCLIAMQLYDDFKLHYQSMIAQFQIFDSQGNLRCPKKSKKNLEDALKAMESLKHPKTNEEIKTIKNLVPNLFVFFKQAQSVVQQMERNCNSLEQAEALKAICRAYQYGKNHRKIKSAKAKKYHKQQEQDWLIIAQIHLEQQQNPSMDFEQYKDQCYTTLDNIVQSSAMVETINSIVRIYLNGCKNQINQAHLNLIMFYHNHRRYVQGKRKGSTPIELLIGQKQQEDWLDLLIKKVHNVA